MIPTRLSAGEIVHVRVHDLVVEPTCRPGLVVVGAAFGVPARIRVIHPTPIGQPIGQADAEAFMAAEAPVWANPDGTTRTGDSWHLLHECPHGE